MSETKQVAVPDTNFSTGAVRSAAIAHLDFTSVPLVGLLGVARTSAEGGEKYGRFNYMKGMPLHDLLNHVFGHYIMFLLGDRSEPHLEHAAWGALLASQSFVLDPEVSASQLLGPGATLSPENIAFLEANAPELAEKRKAGVFEGIGHWNMQDLPEIQRLLNQRAEVAASAIRPDAIEDTLESTPVEKVRRKRRTKAEIEAAKVAESDAMHAAHPVVEPVDPPAPFEPDPTDDLVDAMDAA